MKLFSNILIKLGTNRRDQRNDWRVRKFRKLWSWYTGKSTPSIFSPIQSSTSSNVSKTNQLFVYNFLVYNCLFTYIFFFTAGHRKWKLNRHIQQVECICITNSANTVLLSLVERCRLWKKNPVFFKNYVPNIPNF